MAELLFFGLPNGEGEPPEQALAAMQQRLAQLSLSQAAGGEQQAAAQGAGAAAWAFDSGRQYIYQEQLHGLEGRPAADAPAAGLRPADQVQQPGESPDAAEQGRPPHFGPQWAYLRFSQPVTAAADSLVIGSKLDSDLNASTCRLAFYGRLCALVDPSGAARGEQQNKAAGAGMPAAWQLPAPTCSHGPLSMCPPGAQTSSSCGSCCPSTSPSSGRAASSEWSQMAAPRCAGEAAAVRTGLLLWQHTQVPCRPGSLHLFSAKLATAHGCRGMFQKDTDLGLFAGRWRLLLWELPPSGGARTG